MLIGLWMRCWLVGAGVLGLLGVASAREVVVCDLVREFKPGLVRGEAANRPVGVGQYTFGGVKREALREHPSRDGGDCQVRYTLTLPKVSAKERLALVFECGLPDEARVDDPKQPGNGVVMAVEVAGQRVFEQLIRRPGLSLRSVDLTAQAGETVACVLVTNAAANDSWDWACWVNARVVCRSPGGSESPLLWESDLRQACVSASQLGCKMLVLFARGSDDLTAHYSGVVFEDAAVRGLLETQFILVRLDFDREWKLAGQLQVKRPGTVVVYDKLGNPVAVLSGRLTAAQVLEKLKGL